MDLLRIEVVNESAESVTLAVIGHFTRQHLDELDSVLTSFRAGKSNVLLDLRSLCLMDRDAAGFLHRWQARGVQMINCPPFVQRWVSQCPIGQG